MEKLNEIVSIITITIIIHYNFIQQEIKNIQLNYLYGELMCEKDACWKKKFVEKSNLFKFILRRIIYIKNKGISKESGWRGNVF